MHDDGGDVLRVFQALVNPGFTAVFRSVNTVAEANMPPTDILSCPNPNNMRIGRVDSYVTNGIAAFLFKDRLPGDAGVTGFPYATGTHGDIPNAQILGVPSDISYASRHKRRADIAPFQARQR